MPTYEYACKACEHEWEVVQKMSDDPVKECPACKRGEAKRLVSGASFILKGPGWANDGYS